MPLRPQTQRLQPLQQQESSKRIQSRSQITQDFHSKFHSECDVSECFAENHTVVTFGRFGERWETTGFRPVEFTAVDDDTGDGCAVAADPFCCAVCDDVRSIVKGSDQVSLYESVPAPPKMRQ